MSAPLKRCFCQTSKHLNLFRSDSTKLVRPLHQSHALYKKKKTPSGQVMADPEEVYVRENTLKLLQRMTRFNLDKIFKPKPTKNYRAAKYKLVTTEQLKELEERSLKKAEKKLEMPPYMKSWVDTDTVLSEDPDLVGCDTHNLVFTDVSFNKRNSDRLITIRDTEGKLRLANNAERDRILHTYYPREGKMFHVPEMFSEESLERCLSNGQYEYVLDRACAQFEPNDPDYIRVTHRTYEHINTHRQFDVLRSTRHFGPMSFYLVHYQKMEHLMEDMIQRDMIQDAADLVVIYVDLHLSAECKNKVKKLKDPIKIIQAYVEKDSKHGEIIELALQVNKEATQGQRKEAAQSHRN